MNKSLDYIQPKRIELYNFIRHGADKYPVRHLCRNLGLSASSYYEREKSEDTKVSNREVEKDVEQVFKTHKRRYGSRLIVSKLKDRGISIGRHKVSKILRKKGLYAIQSKSYVPKPL